MHSRAAGRFAPSPSGDLHLGNLRTALLAWLFARQSGRDFLIRMEDLDRVRPGADIRQLADLRALGLSWAEPVRYQSDRLPIYREVAAGLSARGLTFECFCTRREILEAPSAPHAPPGAYPGTCRNLSDSQRAVRRRERPAAIRLRAGVREFAVHDLLHGEVSGEVDDFVLVRGDGTPAYNLAVVVDDADSGIDQVVRGDDLLTSAPRQGYLATLLGHHAPMYAHVPMVLNERGIRLSKRDGAITLNQLGEAGTDPAAVLSLLATSLNLAAADEPVTPDLLLNRFTPEKLPRTPWLLPAAR